MKGAYERRPTVYTPYPSRLERVNINLQIIIITKAALSPQSLVLVWPEFKVQPQFQDLHCNTEAFKRVSTTGISLSAEVKQATS